MTIGVSLLITGAALPAQAPPGASAPPARVPANDRRWTLAAPDAALAWFELLADLHLEGAGAFPFTAPRPVRDTGDAAPNGGLARALERSREFEVLHFVPLYHPSADRAALAEAIRAASAPTPRAPTPRASLLVTALSQSLSSTARRDRLPELAAALGRARPVAPAPAELAVWQRRMDETYAPALASWLRAEHLDSGRLIVSPALGPEGRIFAGTVDRLDNLVAVGSFPKDADPEAPLLAFVRELCFPAVTRAATGASGFSEGDPRSARRASLAAVRCGADLLDRVLPSRAVAYRAFWLRQRAADAGADPSQTFDIAFPADPALQPAVRAALKRVETSPP